MTRTLAQAYGVASSMVFLAAFLYAVGFVGGPPVPMADLADALILLLIRRAA